MLTQLTLAGCRTLFGVLGLSLVVCPAAAETIVLANRSPEVVRFGVVSSPDKAVQAIAPGELTAIPVNRPLTISFQAGDQTRAYELDMNSVYFFHGRGAELNLESIGLGQSNSQAGHESTPGPVGKSRNHAVTAQAGPFLLPVKVLVDEEERAAQPRWEDRLRKRLALASDIIQQHCGVGFRVVEIDTWKSNNETTDFSDALREFKTGVRLGSARIAIGFTSQYELPEGRTNLGGTQGPLDSHILIREWSQHVSEPERAELLVHELGHFLGAAHSPEGDSVMRPVLADRQSLARRFRIGFDPVNTLAMNLVGEGLRVQHVRSLRDLPLPSRKRLADIYSALVGALPDDPAAGRFLEFVGELR